MSLENVRRMIDAATGAVFPETTVTGLVTLPAASSVVTVILLPFAANSLPKLYSQLPFLSAYVVKVLPLINPALSKTVITTLSNGRATPLIV